MSYLGDYTEDFATLNHSFTTRKDTGLPTVLTGSPVVTIYKASSTTGKTSAESYITLTIDFDSKVGLNHVLVDLSGDAFFAIGNDYAIVITTGTVNSISVIGEVIATFSIENRFAEVDVTKWLGTAAATPNVAGVPEVDVTHWTGTAVSAGVGGDGVPASIALADRNAFLTESIKGSHTYQGNHFYVDPVNGGTHASGNRGGRTDPYLTIQDCHDNAVTDSNHDVIFLVAGHGSTATTHTIAGTTTLSKRYLTIRGPGRDFIITRTGAGDTLAITGDGISLSGFQLGTAATGSGHGIKITAADFVKIDHVWILDTQGDGVHILRGSNCIIAHSTFAGTGVGGSGQGVHIVGTGGVSTNNRISQNVFSNTAGDSILIEQGTTNATLIRQNLIHDSSGWAINIGGSSTDAIIHANIFGNNATGNITDAGTTTVEHHNRDWLSATVEGRTLGVETDGDLTKVNLLNGHTAQTGDSFARIGATGSGLTTLATAAALALAKTAIDAIPTTAMRGTDDAALATALATAQAAIDAIPTTAMRGTDSAATAAAMATAQAAIDAIPTTAMRGTDNAALASSLSALFTTVLTESYAADGATATPAQLLYMLWSALTEFAISGTAVTSKKLDGTTTAMTHTLDDATNPTSTTRAS